MRTTNYTDLRSNLKHHLDAVVNDNEPLIVNRSGNNSVVIMNLDDYNALIETHYVLNNPHLMNAIAAAEEEIKYGKTTPQNPNESIEDYLKRLSCTD
jgi:antitoxin YefM